MRRVTQDLVDAVVAIVSLVTVPFPGPAVFSLRILFGLAVLIVLPRDLKVLRRPPLAP
jgi:hypothetical protein